MEISLEDRSTAEVYKLLIGCIVPRPIAWVTTVNRAGLVNLAPFSFFNAVASKPPTISISFAFNTLNEDGRKDSLVNIQTNGELVVNVAREPLESLVNDSAVNYPRELSEPEVLGLETTASLTVGPPRLAASAVALECRREREIQIGEGPGSATLVLAEVQHVFVQDELVNERMHIDVAALAPIGRLAGHDYCYIRDIFSLPRRIYGE